MLKYKIPQIVTLTHKRFELALFTHRISMKLRAILRHTPLGYVVNLTILGG